MTPAAELRPDLNGGRLYNARNIRRGGVTGPLLYRIVDADLRINFGALPACETEPQTLGFSAHFEHQLAPQMPRFTHPMRLNRVLEPVSRNRRRSDRASIKKCQHPFKMGAIANDVRA